MLKSLSEKAFRAAYVETEIETLIPFQIRAMRASRGWSQKELAIKADTTQARVSLLENPSHEGAVNVKTLIKLAEAFDVALVVRFAPFGELAEWSSRLSSRQHLVPDYETEVAEAERALAEERDSAPTLIMKASVVEPSNVVQFRGRPLAA